MTEEAERQYILNDTYNGMDHYECPYCGYCGKALEVPEGTPCPECPVCRSPPHLLPCPVCGRTPKIEWDPNENQDICVFVECGECTYRTGLYEDLDDAVVAWNDRAPPEHAEGITLPKHEIHKYRTENEQFADYRCGCGWMFTLEKRKPAVCPVCEAIEQLTPTLKPCPFCGGAPAIDMRRNPDLDVSCGNGRYEFVVYCTNCLIETAREKEPEDAAEAWNHRPEGQGIWSGPCCCEFPARWGRIVTVAVQTGTEEFGSDIPVGMVMVAVTTKNGMQIQAQITNEDARAMADAIRTLCDRAEAKE